MLQFRYPSTVKPVRVALVEPVAYQGAVTKVEAIMQKFNVLFALRNVTYSAPNVHFLLVGDFTTIILMARYQRSQSPANSGKAQTEADNSEKVMPGAGFSTK